LRLLFVCLGNICRSPTAEGVMRSLVEREGLAGQIELDSAGTGAWHMGSSPDGRARGAARGRGIELEGRARRVEPEDFERFDLLLAMDKENARELRALARDQSERAKVRLLREFDPDSAARGAITLPSSKLAVNCSREAKRRALNQTNSVGRPHCERICVVRDSKRKVGAARRRRIPGMIAAKQDLYECAGQVRRPPRPNEI